MLGGTFDPVHVGHVVVAAEVRDRLRLDRVLVVPAGDPWQKRGQVVSYDELFLVVKSGRNRDNVRKHVSTIRESFREIDPRFDSIENVPMRGFRWVTE